MIQTRRRRRRSASYSLAETTDMRGRKWWGMFIAVVLVAWIFWSVLHSWLPKVSGQRVATILETEGRGSVHVSISGEKETQRAENGLRLYDSDSVTTGPSSSATLRFFDGTVVTLDEGSALQLDEVVRGEESSVIALQLQRGRLWIATSTGATVMRTLDTPFARYTLPPRTRAIIGAPDTSVALEQEEHASVFETFGPGVETALRNSGRNTVAIVVGEGQRVRLTPQAVSQIREAELHPYDLRDALGGEILSSVFYLRNAYRGAQASASSTASSSAIEGEQLVVDAPEDGELLEGSTVVVRGRVGSRVAAVRVNGYGALLTGSTFEKEIALPESEEVNIEVQAEDHDGIMVDSLTLHARRDIKPPDPPVITAPGGSGDTVVVQDDSFEIVGNASPDAAGIMVNGYQLQKFRSGAPWRYLVDPTIGNVRVGENTYEIVALDRAGNRSVPARITIVWKAQALPIMGERGDRTDMPGTVPTLERDAYLLPNSLRIVAPTTGEKFISMAEEVLLEGETSSDTAAISINGFTLTRYLPGKTTWNYIAKEAFGNYRPGVNRYTVVARNAQGQILDVLQYLIEVK